MAHPTTTRLTKLLTSAAPPERVREAAREVGALVRQRKVDVYALLMVVVLGVSMRGPTAVAQLGHILAEATGTRLARSSFWSRLSPSFARLVFWLLDELVGAAREPKCRPPGRLRGFRDVVAVDATVVKVHDALSTVWRGTRTNSAAAALKVHAWVRVFTGELLRYKITGETTADCHAFGVSHDLRDVLVLLDRGYSSQSLWRRIQGVGGYFLTRLPADRDPIIVTELRRHRGRARQLAGQPLRTALSGLQRNVVEVECSFRCCVRKYRRRTNRWVDEHFRVIAIKNPKTGEYAVYVTNAPPQLLPADLARTTYRLRWEIETFFKTAKSGAGLAELPSRKKHVVKALVAASLIRATAAMQAKAHLAILSGRDCALDINPGQWMRWWTRQLQRILEGLLDAGNPLGIDDMIDMLRDPNRKRVTTRRSFTVPPGCPV